MICGSDRKGKPKRRVILISMLRSVRRSVLRLKSTPMQPLRTKKQPLYSEDRSMYSPCAPKVGPCAVKPLRRESRAHFSLNSLSLSSLSLSSLFAETSVPVAPNKQDALWLQPARIHTSESQNLKYVKFFIFRGTCAHSRFI